MYRQSQLQRRRRSLGEDEAHLPQGQCRYILLHPEVKGLRCACVGFSLNRETPGSSCDCGHQACYHVPTKEDRATEHEQVEALKDRVAQLENSLQSERNFDKRSLVLRISQLEELLDKYRAEMETEVKSAFRGIEGLWHNVGRLQRFANVHEDRLDSLLDASQAAQDDTRAMRTRLAAVDETSMSLEDRVDVLEGNRTSRGRHASSPPSTPREVDGASLAFTEPLVIPRTHISLSSEPQPWTVHVSLLPKASQPFPFEQNTVAYRRVLSRGLHQIVTIPDKTSRSFKAAISDAFAGLLRDRLWMPLAARICDARNLAGLPMLRQLQQSQLDCPYDYEFLKHNCATVDEDGRILDLYIAMRNDTFSWHELHRSLPYRNDLESCWDYDPVLDGPRVDDDALSYKDSSDEANFGDEVPSAGDILRTWSPPTTRLKRNASAVSRHSSFGSVEGEAKRSKMQQRQRVGTPIERTGWITETV